MLDTRVDKIMSSVDGMRSVDVNDSLQNIVDVFITKNEVDERSKIFTVLKNNKIVGIITVGDILKAAKRFMKMYSAKEMKTIGSLRGYGQKEFIVNLEKQIKTGTDLKAGDLIRFTSRSLKQSASLSHAFDLMLKNNLKVVSVLDEDNAVIGIVKDVDLLACIADFIE